MADFAYNQEIMVEEDKRKAERMPAKERLHWGRFKHSEKHSKKRAKKINYAPGHWKASQG